MIDTNNIISNIYIVPIEPVSVYIKNSNLIGSLKRTLEAVSLYPPHNKLINGMYTQLVTDWLIDHYGKTVIPNNTQIFWEVLPQYKNVAALLTPMLMQHLSNVPLHRHGRRVYCSVYTFNTQIHILVRSCHEHN